MKPLTLEWIEKAEEDWVVMLRSYRARKDPSYNAPRFHSQQCAEKYLKGGLEEARIAFNKTRDLTELYPGQSAAKIDAKQSVQDCRKVRAAARVAFGLPV